MSIEDKVFDQYKICIEMADKISQRRVDNNKFFLAINSSLITITGVVFSLTEENWSVMYFTILIALIGFILSYTWYRLIKSYRQLNTAKFKVIGELEKALPKSPFFEMEWKMLGEGKDKKLYTPFSGLEQNVPILFGIVYIILPLFYFISRH